MIFVLLDFYFTCTERNGRSQSTFLSFHYTPLLLLLPRARLTQLSLSAVPSTKPLPRASPPAHQFIIPTQTVAQLLSQKQRLFVAFSNFRRQPMADPTSEPTEPSSIHPEASRQAMDAHLQRHSMIPPTPGGYRSEYETKQRQRCTCPNCGKAFGDLKAHILIHQTKRPEKCPIQTYEYS
ncbi:hypothetical protein DER44DRAFT_122958 [Fusarium oxysporum]|nr:hypothetical protein DER44DRAFT_122958 [Fusarium oxysporum]